MTTKSLLHSLTEEETVLLRETERPALEQLDEDDLVELHTRVRRARTKYVKQYRRGAAQRVAASGGRGKAAPKNRRAADKAEVFEDALASVSTALAKAARLSAKELRAERIAAAREGRQQPPEVSPPEPGVATKARDRSARKTPATRKSVASSRAVGARRQAKRDQR